MEKELPKHVGIIMDGNGRWATDRGLKRSLGHKAGADNLEGLMEHIFNLGIKYVSVYAFSTENFKRDKEEVDYLMDLFVKMFSLKKRMFINNKIKVLFSGQRDNLRKDVVESMEKLEKETCNFNRGVFNICLNYGGRTEIVDMTKRITQKVLEGKIDISDIDCEMISKNLYQDLPDLDIVIRTSGEMRVSNFMLWQASYAEYFFPKTYFPDFNGDEFDKVLEEFYLRNRRFGG